MDNWETDKMSDWIERLIKEGLNDESQFLSEISRWKSEAKKSKIMTETLRKFRQN
jgi:hypothetical protein